MRLRGPAPSSESRPWTDALALFSLTVPLFLLVVDILAVALPYRLPQVPASPLFARLIARYPEIGGLSLLHVPVFDVTVGGELITAVLVLLGLRWMTLGVLAASVLCWVAAGHSMPWDSVPGAAGDHGGLSPGGRRPDRLARAPARASARELALRGGSARGCGSGSGVHGRVRRDDAVLAPGRDPPEVTIYLAGSVVLAAAVLVLAVVWKLNWYVLLILAAMSWPYAIQLAFTATGGSTDLLGNPTPAHLAALYLPPVLFACGTVLAAVVPHRSRLQPS